MPLIRKDALQGHAVPRGASPARGPFPAEIFAKNPRAEENFPKSDYLHDALADVRYFRCRDCGETMTEEQLDAHLCVENEWEIRRTFQSNSLSASGDLTLDGLELGSAEGSVSRDYEEAEYALDDIRSMGSSGY